MRLKNRFKNRQWEVTKLASRSVSMAAEAKAEAKSARRKEWEAESEAKSAGGRSRKRNFHFFYRCRTSLLTSDQLVHVKRPNVEAFGEIGEDTLENVAT